AVLAFRRSGEDGWSAAECARPGGVAGTDSAGDPEGCGLATGCSTSTSARGGFPPGRTRCADSTGGDAGFPTDNSAEGSGGINELATATSTCFRSESGSLAVTLSGGAPHGGCEDENFAAASPAGGC